MEWVKKYHEDLQQHIKNIFWGNFFLAFTFILLYYVQAWGLQLY